MPEVGKKPRCCAQRFGIGPKTLDMYIKLNDLIPELLDMVDANAVDSKNRHPSKGRVSAGILPLTNSQQVVVAVLLTTLKSC